MMKLALPPDESTAIPALDAFQRLPRERAWLGYVQQLAEGNEEGLASLYDETNSLVYGLVLRMLSNVKDAEEITLDVYKQVWRSARSFDAERGTVTAWLMTMARTRSLDNLRAKARRPRTVCSLPQYSELPSQMDTPEEQTAASQQRNAVLAALRQLPGNQRRAIELAYFDGLSHLELADALGEPLGTIKTSIRRGLIRLRGLMGAAIPAQPDDPCRQRPFGA